MDDSISCCAFQNNKDWLTMVCSGGKLKTDSFTWVLLQVYYQIGIPYPVQHSKAGKTGFEWNLALWSSYSLSCCAFQHRKTKQEMALMTCGLSSCHLYGFSFPVEQEMEFLFGKTLTCKVGASVSCSLKTVHEFMK